MAPVIFLDRDGVINRDSPDYIKTPGEFCFIPKSPEAVALLNDNGFEVILITNQSALGRKMVTPVTLDAILEKMRQGVAAAGGRIRDIFFCPHTPDQGCACRKPRPGMIQAAAARHGIDVKASVMVGDSVKDIQCGRAAGCGTTILVATGNGRKALAELAEKGDEPDYFAEDLFQAAQWIVANIAGPEKQP